MPSWDREDEQVGGYSKKGDGVLVGAAVVRPSWIRPAASGLRRGQDAGGFEGGDWNEAWLSVL